MRRWDPRATLLADGSVLFTGGEELRDGQWQGARTIQRYSPGSQNLTLAGELRAQRVQHAATLLPDGRVLITGGFEKTGLKSLAMASAEIYNPSSEATAESTEMGLPRGSHTASVVPDGRILIAGGRARLGASDALDTAELYTLVPPAAP